MAGSFQVRLVLVGALALAVVIGAVFFVCSQGPSAVRREPVQTAESGSARSSMTSGPSALRPPQPPAPPAPPSVRSGTDVKTEEKIVGFEPPPAFPSPDVNRPETASIEFPNFETEGVASQVEEARPVVALDVTTAFGKAVADVRIDMAHRDLDAAGMHIKIATAEAQTDDDRDQVDRLKAMLDYLASFWEGIQASMARLQAAEEIVLKDTRVVVIDSGRDFLNVKLAGRVYRFQVKTLPTSLVMALVDQRFGTDTGSKAIIGAFLAVDPRGDRSLARQYWDEAARDGIETARLLPEIDAMPPVIRRNGQKTKDKDANGKSMK